MPPAETKQEGRGNGCKTLLVNIDAVALALGREPGRIMKYLGKTLATNGRYKGGSATLGGHFDASRVQQGIDDFIDRDVLCELCLNPETDIHIKNGKERLRCKACGHKSPSIFG